MVGESGLTHWEDHVLAPSGWTYRSSRQGDIAARQLPSLKGVKKSVVEVKNLNATVRVNADTWLADKYDRYGNLVEQYTIADRRGRSPSEQLNQPADELASFLHRRGQPVPVRRVVVLAHERSKLGEHANLTVSVALTSNDILRLVQASPDRLDARHRASVQSLIEHDHAFHAKRRPVKRAR